MDAETGLLRMAKVIEMLGWIWAALCVAAAGIWGYPDAVGFGVLIVIIGGFGYALAWAIAWIIKGFAHKKA